ncbi:MAG: prepilin-type N-terminal cleavage/methylation domain-containing protein [Polyangiaceae bacterium]|nr:prepilin-type N-terminal cleavage/methylation domain-containing protein [Polyangiaceae bacterium]MCB9605239.1 prepilin-type N-terminal cleavage/methylation domain-containing protein [Polyangiaceae bacterium]
MSTRRIPRVMLTAVRPASRTGQRGFTLAELMVAITGGLFISIAVFSMARFGSRFYQQESRVANATMSSVVGFERLKADITRAGFLASPNVQRDPNVCGQPATDASWPVQLRDLAAIQITPNFLTGNAVLDTAANGNIQPDQITLAGSYVTGDEFPIRLIQQTGSGYDVTLQVLTGPMARLGTANLNSVFQPGRALRIIDESGKQQYGTITGTSFNAGQPVVSLSQSPQLILRQGGSQQCGFKGLETGARANVVNFIRYELRNMTGDAAHAALFADTNAAVLGDSSRVELVRYEINTAGNQIQGTQEIVAELAVDLAFSIRAVDVDTDLNQSYANALSPIGTAAAPSAGGRPERIRVVRTRLSVRSREADRAGQATPPNGVPNELYRIALNPSATAANQRWARVRTIQADISLPNLMGTTW